MKFYDATNQDGLCQEVDRLCDTSDTNYSRLAKTSRINTSQDEVVSWIITADGTFEFDDKNQTDLPRATFTLQEGVAKYNFATEFLRILELEIKDANGVYRRIKPLDPDQLGDMSWDEYFGTTSGSPNKGFPEYYDPNADGLVLGPAPTSTAVTLAAGGRVTFQRKPVAFTATSATTTDSTEPGFASPFHVVLAYMAALPYCMTYKKDRVALYAQKVADLRTEIIQFYSRRNRDKRTILTPNRINFI